MTGRGWTYDDMADQTGGRAVCGLCRHGHRAVLAHSSCQQVSLNFPGRSQSDVCSARGVGSWAFGSGMPWCNGSRSLCPTCTQSCRPASRLLMWAAGECSLLCVLTSKFTYCMPMMSRALTALTDAMSHSKEFDMPNRLNTFTAMTTSIAGPQTSMLLSCGRAGEALLTLAAAYPHSTFHGYDIAQTSLDCAASRRVAEPWLSMFARAYLIVQCRNCLYTDELAGSTSTTHHMMGC